MLRANGLQSDSLQAGGLQASCVFKLLLFFLAIAFVYYSRSLLFTSPLKQENASEYSPPLYLPKIEAVKATTLGYEHFVSTVLWFNTIHYFGSQFETKKAMPWFSHMCDLVTELNPKGRHVFEFCGTLVSWIAREPNRCIAILSKGIKHDPDYWRYYYLRGFTYWYFLEDLDTARKDFEFAAKLPDAPVFLSSLASRLISASGDVESAIAFLKASIKSTRDERAKNALKERIRLAYVTREIGVLEEIIKTYHNEQGHTPESLDDLLLKGYVKFFPHDPYGDPYQYDANTNEVFSLKGKKGLHFPGKTAKTGIAKKEAWVSNE